MEEWQVRLQNQLKSEEVQTCSGIVASSFMLSEEMFYDH